MIPAHYGIICKLEGAGIEEGVQQTALGQNDDRGNVVAQSDLLTVYLSESPISLGSPKVLSLHLVFSSVRV